MHQRSFVPFVSLYFLLKTICMLTASGNLEQVAENAVVLINKGEDSVRVHFFNTATAQLKHSNRTIKV
jgi:hypothetical protein